MKIIDLSHAIDNNTPNYEGDIKTELNQARTIYRDGFEAYSISSFFHSSTHIEVKRHMLHDDKYINDYSIDRFFGKGVLLNYKDEKILNTKAEYRHIDLKDKIVLIYTSFDSHYHQNDYFTSHPIISEELIDFLISKEIKIIGLDFPSPDYEPYLIHKKLFNNDIPIVENLTNLKELLDIKKFNIYALPLKLRSESSFVRVIALVD